MKGGAFLYQKSLVNDVFVPEDFNPSFVFKLKQNLWHAGILRFKAHHSSGKRGSIYQPQDDFWQLEQNSGGLAQFRRSEK